MTYEIGVTYIWQGQTGEMACLNGTECTVTGGKSSYVNIYGDVHMGWPTDTVTPYISCAHTTWAFPGDLRRKQPPTGEKSVMDLFDVPVAAPKLREVEAA